MSQGPQLEALDPAWQETDLPFAAAVRSFVSGDPTGDRIRVRYYRSAEADVLWGRVWFGPGAEGPPGHCHGGAQAAALDEICGGCVWVHGHQVVALKLETEFLDFVPLGTELVLKGWIVRRDQRKIFTEGTIADSEGKILARGRVLFIELKQKHIDKLGSHLISRMGEPSDQEG